MKDLNEKYEANPFKVPEEYFRDLNSRIIDATCGKVPEVQKKGITIRLRPFLAVAASLVIMAILGYSAMKLIGPARKMPSAPELSLQEFSDLYINDFDIQTLEEDNDPIALYNEIPDIKKSEIIDYLLLENVNDNDIYELL
jgi:hypothetical protein